jgi:probable rRNA maturation factor
MEILIDNRTEGWEINQDEIKLIDTVCETTFNHLGDKTNFEVSISFVTNEEIRELNRTYRNKDSATDVLSFPMEEEFELDFENTILGDVVISVDRIREQAEEFKHSFQRELSYLLVHSLLHLLGFDHIEEDEKLEMRKEEKEIMDKLKIYK